MGKLYIKLVTAQAPVNIAVIKYWGKKDEALKIPINDSISGTLDLEDMCTTTSIYLSDRYHEDKFWLNGKSVDFKPGIPAHSMLEEIRFLARDGKNDQATDNYHVRIVSVNNFPTAAGLASSAAGYACLAYALGHTFGITDTTLLSKIARKGSGSACRSLFGGFVHWISGVDHDSSVAQQITTEASIWEDLRVVICVVNDQQKDVSSSLGMTRSVETSELLKVRAEQMVPKRIERMKHAILKGDFQTFSTITMQDSNQFHSICLDTYPPIFYLNETSRKIIKICHLINSQFKTYKVAYTFDAGPNACIYMLDDFVEYFIEIIDYFFSQPASSQNRLESIQREHIKVRGRKPRLIGNTQLLDELIQCISAEGIAKSESDSINYIINTKLGSGPRLSNDHNDIVQGDSLNW